MTFTNTLSVAGNITFGTGMTIAGLGTLATTNTSTITSAGKAFLGTVSFTGTTAYTVTLADNLTTNNLQYNTSGGSVTQTVNDNNIFVNGNLIVFTAGGRIATGTTHIHLQGTGSWQMGSGTSTLRNNLTIKSGANYTFNVINTGGVGYDTGTLTIENGATVSMFAGSSLLFRQNVTYVGIDNLVIEVLGTTANNPTVTTDSQIRAKTFNCNTNVTFAGSDGTFDFDEINIGTVTIASRTIILKAGATYKINNSIDTPSASDLGRTIVQSSSLGNKAYINIPSSATQKLSNVNFTDIEATTGTIWVYNGTISNCTNVKQLQHYQPTITYSS